MRKFVVTILLVFVTLGFSQSFGYFEGRLFCNVDQQNVTIFFNNQEGTTRCQVYLDTIYQLAVQKYKEISLIRGYISEGEDVYYWREILKEKKSELSQLVSYRIQIKNAMAKFEDMLFIKYYNMFRGYMESYYLDIETQYYMLINSNSAKRMGDYSSTLKKLEQQMGNVSDILNSENMDQMMKAISSYIYMKKQLAGK